MLSDEAVPVCRFIFMFACLFTCGVVSSGDGPGRVRDVPLLFPTENLRAAPPLLEEEQELVSSGEDGVLLLDPETGCPSAGHNKSS